MDLKLPIREEEVGVNTTQTAGQHDPAKVYAAARELADVIKCANVEDVSSTIQRLAFRIDSSAIFNFRELSRGSLFHIAAASGNSDILRFLLNYVDAHLVAARDDWGNTPLHIAIKAKALEVADMLIRLAKELPGDEKILEIKNNHGNTALHEAVLTRDIGLVSLLLRENLEPVYWMNVDQKSPLYLALDTGNSEIFEIFFSNSFELAKIEGLSPIHGAVARDHYGLVAKVLDKSMKLFAMPDSKGGNVFHLAAFLKKPKVFHLLRPETEYLARERDKNGNLPIHIASKMGHVALIKKLHPVSQTVNREGQTVLHMAAKYGRASAVRHILRHPELGMLINERDHDGNTALHLAVMHSQPAVLISLVLDKKIDISLHNPKGLTALDIALDRFGRDTTFRKKMAAVVMESASAGSGDLFVRRPEAQDQPYSTMDVLKRLPHLKLNKEAVNTRLLVAALVTTVTFAAGFTVPGGFNGWDTAFKEDRGMATMLDKRKFQAFAICNTIAMFSSMIAVIHLMLGQHSDVHKAIAALSRVAVPLTIALLAMSAAFLTGVTLIIGKLPSLANTIFYSGFVCLLLILGAVLSQFEPFFQTRHRRIRLLMFWLDLAYINWWKIDTYPLDDQEEDGTASGTSASQPPDGAGNQKPNVLATAKCGDAPYPPSH